MRAMLAAEKLRRAKAATLCDMRTIGGGEGAKYSMFAFGGTVRAARVPFLPPRLRPPFPPSHPALHETPITRSHTTEVRDRIFLRRYRADRLAAGCGSA